MSIGPKRLVDETFGDNRIVIDSFGGPLLLVGYRSVRGSGFQLLVVNRSANERAIFRYTTSEDAVVDYSDLERGILRITWYTWDVLVPAGDEEFEQVPFVLETLLISGSGLCKSCEELLLAPEEGGPERVDELRNAALRALKQRDLEKAEIDYSSALIRLRNIGVSSPERVLEALRLLKGHVDGYFAVILSGHINEVEWIQDIKVTHNEGLHRAVGAGASTDAD